MKYVYMLLMMLGLSGCNVSFPTTTYTRRVYTSPNVNCYPKPRCHSQIPPRLYYRTPYHSYKHPTIIHPPVYRRNTCPSYRHDRYPYHYNPHFKLNGKDHYYIRPGETIIILPEGK